MQIRSTTNGRQALRYYVFGESRPELVLIGVPGMSARFFLPLARQLESRVSILAFEYRGFAPGAKALDDDEATFECCLEDLLRILDVEEIQHASFAAWCAGGFMLMELLERRPALIDRMVALGAGADPNGDSRVFESAVAEIREALARNPATASRLITMMRRLGMLRDDAYFEALIAEGDDPEQAATEELLPFMLFREPATLSNYARLLLDFLAHERPVRHVGRPLLLVKGVSTAESATSDAAPHELAVPKPASRAEGGREVMLAQATNFLLLERPRALAACIAHHLALQPFAPARGGSAKPLAGENSRVP
jgi:pimeloyl-ACP methyl ester carboxylesterase